MLEQKQFLSELRKSFRLNIYEVKIWTALLSRGVASAGELADISGVPRSRCYDVLESLEKKGFIIMKLGKPIKYLAVRPDIILERVKQNIKGDAENVSGQMDNITGTDEFRELELLHKTGVQHVDISSISKSVVGRTSINRYIKDMISRAKSKILFVAAGGHSERAVKLLKTVQNHAKKGISIKLHSSYNKTLLKRLPDIEFFEHASDSSFVSIDGKEIIFLLSPDNVVAEYEVAIWISSQFFVSAVDILFEIGSKQNVTLKN